MIEYLLDLFLKIIMIVMLFFIYSEIKESNGWLHDIMYKIDTFYYENKSNQK